MKVDDYPEEHRHLGRQMKIAVENFVHNLELRINLTLTSQDPKYQALAEAAKAAPMAYFANRVHEVHEAFVDSIEEEEGELIPAQAVH